MLLGPRKPPAAATRWVPSAEDAMDCQPSLGAPVWVQRLGLYSEAVHPPAPSPVICTTSPMLALIGR
jgi:hypothetical protein